jgi:hypothetical protein
MRAALAALSRASRWLSPGVRFEPKDDSRRCAACGYPFPGGIHGVASACSECGRFVDPADPSAFAREIPPRIVLRAMRAPGLLFLALAIAVGLLLLHSFAVPGGRQTEAFVGIGLFTALGLFAAVRMTIALVCGWRLGRSRDVWKQRGWWVPALVPVVLPLLGLLHVPRSVAFLVDRPRLAALAAAWEEDPKTCRQEGGDLFVPLRDEIPMDALEFVQFARLAEDIGGDKLRGFVVIIPASIFMDRYGVYLYMPAFPQDFAERSGLLWHGGAWYSGVVNW